MRWETDSLNKDNLQVFMCVEMRGLRLHGFVFVGVSAIISLRLLSSLPSPISHIYTISSTK